MTTHRNLIYTKTTEFTRKANLLIEKIIFNIIECIYCYTIKYIFVLLQYINYNSTLQRITQTVKNSFLYMVVHIKYVLRASN